MSCTSMTSHLRSRSYGMVLLAFLVLSSCTGIINAPESNKQTNLSVKAGEEVYSQAEIDLVYEEKPKGIKAYCILENSKDQKKCYWVNADLPKKFISETGDGRKVLTVWVKNKKNVVSKPYSTPPFVIDTTSPVWTSAAISLATSYASLSQSPPITYSQTAVDALTTVRYQYAIGSSTAISNRADVKNWTDVGSNLPFHVSGLSLTNGATYYVSMRAVDEANNISTVFTSTGWLASVTSVSDPSFVSITPASPSSNSSPVIVGTVGADVQTVNLYSNASCTVSLGSGTRADFVGAGITLTMPPNPGTATTIYGRGEDSNSDLSNCVLLTSYRHDSVGPTVSRVYSNTAAGFYNDGDIIDIRVEFNEAVTVVGIPTIELETGGSDAVVNYVSQPAANTLLFSYMVASGHVSADLNYVATSSLTVGTSIKDAAGNDATLTLPGLATGNSLAGQEALVIDTTAPAAPGIALQSPASSPGTDSTPTFTVSLEGGGNFLSSDVITLHEGADCSATAVATLTTQTGASALITRSSAMSEGSTDFRVRVTDAAGNATCSTSHGTAGSRVATYRYDNTAPAVPSIVLSSPASSPGTDSTPTFEIALTGGGNFLSSDVITLHEGADCSGGAVATLTSETGTSAFITRSSAMAETTTDFRVKVTDEAGNASCSTSHTTAGSRVASYNYDNTPPAAPSIALQSPSASPGTDSTPTFTIALTGGGNFASTDTITLHEGADCSAAAVATLTSQTGASALITRSSAMSAGSTDFRVKVTDAAGNNTCSTSHATVGSRVATYEFDNTAPAAPSIVLSSPAFSPGVDSTPSFTITLQGGGNFVATDTITLFNAASCGGTSVGTSTGNTGASVVIATSSAQAANNTTTYSARVTEQSGNSTCSSLNTAVALRSRDYKYEVIMLNAQSVSLNMNSGQTFTFAAAGGTAPYTYSLDSGTGSIHPTTGVFTAGTSATQSVVRVTDSAANSVTANVNHYSILVNGEVRAVASDPLSGATYLGGLFTGAYPLQVHKATALSTSNGNVDLAFDIQSGFNDDVVAIARDPLSGDIYVGGDFSHYRGVEVNYIAKLDRYGNLDTTFKGAGNIGFDDIVTSLALDATNNVLYVGGWFNGYRGVADSAYYIAKLSTIDGAIDTTFHPVSATGGFDSGVEALALDATNNALYLGGWFNEYRGVADSAYYIAKLSTIDGAIDTTFHPVSATGGFDSGVETLALDTTNNALFVGGWFDEYRGVTNSAYHIAKLSTSNGAIDTSFHPVSATGGFDNPVFALAVDSVNGKLYVGGRMNYYRNVANAARFIAKLSTTDGAIDTTFHPVSATGGFNDYVHSLSLDVANNTLYVGGSFTSYRNVANSAKSIAKISTTNGALETTFQPASAAGGFGNTVYALAVDTANNKLYVGGRFDYYRSQLDMAYIAKVTPGGTIDTTFYPNSATGGFDSNVETLALDSTNNKLYVGGAFSSYRNVANSARKVAKLSTTDGAIDTTFHPVSATGGFNDTIHALALDAVNGQLYVGGKFSTYRNVANSARYIAKLSTTDGAIDTTFHPVSAKGGFSWYVYALQLDVTNGKLYVGGDFSTYRNVANSARKIAKLSTTNGAIDTTFHPVSATGGFNGDVRALQLDATNNKLYVGGGYNTYRNVADSARYIAKLSTTDGAIDTTFHPVSATGGFFGGVNALALDIPNSQLYAGGDFQTYRGVTNSAIRIAKISTTDGAIDTTFHPVSVNEGFDKTVRALSYNSAHSFLTVGGAMTYYKNQPQPHLSFIRTDGQLYTAPSAAPGLALSSPASSPGADSTPSFSISLEGGGNFAAGDTVKLYAAAACAGTSVGTSTGNTGASVVIETSSAQAAGNTTTYSALLSDSNGNSRCSSAHGTVGSRSVSYARAPAIPTTLARQSPTGTPGTDSTPTIRVTGGGVANGATVKLFSDSACTAQVGSATADATPQADVTSSALSEGSHIFYATVEINSVSSGCSTASVAYQYDNTAPTWSDTLSHAATHNSTTQTPSISFTANAADTGGSGIQKYQYSIGTSAGGTQVVTWTDLAGGAAPTSPFQAGSLTLTVNTTYHINMRAMDNAGLTSTEYSSDWLVVAVPTLSYSGATGTHSAIGRAMTVTPTTLNNNGSAITNCAATPALPAWATLNTTTCVITGTPNAALAATEYSVVATNAVGDSSAATVTLRVDPLPTGSISIATGASHTTVNPVILNLVGNYATEMYVTNTADCSAGGAWEALSSIKNWTLAQTNATATVAVKYKNSFGDESACYTDTIVHDDTAPAAPGFVSFDPASPSSSTTPKVIGTSDADTFVVQIFKDSSCLSKVGSGTKAQFDGSGVTFNTLFGTNLSYYAVAMDTSGNRSACTLMDTYVTTEGATADSWQLTSFEDGSSPTKRSEHTAVWTGSKMIIWGGYTYNMFSDNRGWIYDPVSDSWIEISNDGAPSERFNHRAVWTGSKMVIWGGGVGWSSFDNQGAVYDPILDSWTSVSTTNAPVARGYHTQLWTGSKMIVWGGMGNSSTYLNSGGVYDLDTDTWTSISTTGAPTGRSYADGVWTGSKMIVWGGYAGSRTNTGGMYDPLTDTWVATSTVSAPSARDDHTAIWTGSKMIVWGGNGGAGNYSMQSGGVFDPTSNSWSAINTGGSVEGRHYHSAIWTGTKMIVYGGYGSINSYSNTGAIYDPATDSWTATTTTNAPANDSGPGHSNIWTGSRMIVFGGDDIAVPLDEGKSYDPVADTWANLKLQNERPRFGQTVVWADDRAIRWGGNGEASSDVLDSGVYYRGNLEVSLSGVGAPSERYWHSAVWTGSKMIVWGGSTNSVSGLNTGAQYDAIADTWSATTTTGAPVARREHSAIWTGSKMIVWGGTNTSGTNINTGAQYDPVANSWSATTTSGAPAARSGHTALWTGTEMIIWGGNSLTNTGARYNPTGNSWTTITTTGAPSARTDSAIVWMGTHMLVWGGSVSGGRTNTGGKYDPVGNSWTAMTTTGAPLARWGATGVWTGAELIVWGGGTPTISDTGGRYNPITNSWSATTTTNAPSARYDHSAIWTGSKMLIIGGQSYEEIAQKVIGIYSPAAKPAAPSIVLNSPASSPGSDSTPTFEVALTGGGNFAATDIITLHEDQYCTGTAVATLTGETGTSALITRSSAMTDEATATFRVKVTNAGGASSCSNDHATVGLRSATYNYDTTPPPTISYAGATGTSGSRGAAMSITPTTLTAGAGATITNCAISAGGALPTGLSIDTSTCVISGTPTTLVSSNAYTVTVTNSFALTANANVTITVSDEWDDASDASIGFAGGTKTGVAWSSSMMQLGSAGSCDATATNCSELTSSWAPQWASLRSYWKMNETSWNGTASEVLDAKGTNHGTAAGNATTTSSAKVGVRAGTFDGTGDYVSAATMGDTLFNSAEAGSTLSAWINVSAFNGNWQAAINQGGNGAGFWYLGVNQDPGYENTWLGIPDGSIGCVLLTPVKPVLNTWAHVVMKHSGTSYAMYVNGEQVSNATCSGNGNTAALNFGYAAGVGEYFNGKIDEVAIWNTALSDDEIRLIYGRQSPSFSGHFVSRVFDAQSSISWDGIKWISSLPFGKELPGDSDNSGTITAADSETTTDYSDITSNNLMDNLEALWRMNGTVGTIADSATLTDSSGAANDATIFDSDGSNTIAHVAGKLGEGVYFDGTNDYASAPLDLSGTNVVTLSFWMKWRSFANNDDLALEFTPNFNLVTTGFMVNPNSGGAMSGFFGFAHRGNASYSAAYFPRPTANVWHHYVFVFNKGRATQELSAFVNGVEQSLTYTQDNNNTDNFGNSTLYLMSRAGSSLFANGDLDEVALWSRELTENEIVQLYRRGANRTKFQVRTCTTSNCGDAPAWEGPDGTPNTYFSEIHNNTTINAAGQATGRVKVNFMDLVFFDFSSVNLPTRQYFQYKAVLESDGLCDLDSDGSADDFCSPDVKSVEVTP